MSSKSTETVLRVACAVIVIGGVLLSYKLTWDLAVFLHDHYAGF